MGATTLNGHVTSNMCLANVSDLASMVGFVTRHPYAFHQAQAVMAAGRMNAGLRRAAGWPGGRPSATAMATSR